MNTLVIYAHPSPSSFNAAIKDTVVEALMKRGDSVEVRDLYAMKFDPVLQPAAPLGEDVLQEQKYIIDADHIIIVNPIWWFNMPAILKGYIDRVFTYGFAYAYGEAGIDGLLKGKNVTIINTAGGANEVYEANGINDALMKTIAYGIYAFSGLEIAKYYIAHNVIQASDEQRADMLSEIKSLVS